MQKINCYSELVLSNEGHKRTLAPVWGYNQAEKDQVIHGLSRFISKDSTILYFLLSLKYKTLK
jgi:hypothetical protein